MHNIVVANHPWSEFQFAVDSTFQDKLTFLVTGNFTHDL